MVGLIGGGNFQSGPKHCQKTLYERMIGTANETEIQISGCPVKCLVDTGSMITTCNIDLFNSLPGHIELKSLEDFGLDVYCADGNKLPFMGYFEAEISCKYFGGNQVCVPVLVVPVTEYNNRVPVTLGTNVIRLFSELGLNSVKNDICGHYQL